jgi:pyridoxamine 5'-phosphate oxidase family protein
LATIDRHGRPHVVPLGWTYNRQLGTLDVGGRDNAATRKFRNVRRNPNVAIVIDDVLPPWRPRAVMIRGSATALDDAVDADGRPTGPIIRIRPTRVTSWGLDNTESSDRINGLHHVAVSITDLHRSVEWYTRVLGCTHVTDLPTATFDATVLSIAGGPLIKLMQHHATHDGAFDERRVGLDHIAFTVPDPEGVDAWAARLDTQGVEHSGVKNGALPGSRLVVFRDPDGIQLEIYSPAPPTH